MRIIMDLSFLFRSVMIASPCWANHSKAYIAGTISMFNHKRRKEVKSSQWNPVYVNPVRFFTLKTFQAGSNANFKWLIYLFWICKMQQLLLLGVYWIPFFFLCNSSNWIFAMMIMLMAGRGVCKYVCLSVYWTKAMYGWELWVFWIL